MAGRVLLAGQVAVECERGRLRVRGRQPALVFAFLVLERHREVQREELAELLWPGRLPDHWAGAVRGVVAKVRAFVDAAGIGLSLRTGTGTIRLVVPDDVTVDIEEAHRLVDEAERALDGDQLDAVAAMADAAVAVLGELFLASEDGPWIWGRRERIADLWRRAHLATARAHLARGDVEHALTTIDVLIGRDGLDEEAVRLAMSALVQGGRRPAALAAYERLRARLDDELAVRPSKQTEALWLATLGGAPAPRPHGAPTTPIDRRPFVGRGTELAALARLLGEADGRGLRLVLVEGEAGIGKSRLIAQWLASTAEARSVLWGRCSGARLPFEPIVEALTRRFSSDPDAVDRIGRFAGTLAAVLPDIFGEPDEPSADPALVRSRLFRAFAAAIADAARDGGAVLVIDDLQAADADTIALLRYLDEALASETVVIAMTVKEAGGDVNELLADLQRRGLERIALGGLTDDEVGDLLIASGVEPARARSVASTLRTRTAGNPLYVHQLVDEASGAGVEIDPEAVPGAIRELLGRRVATLSTAAADALQMSAAAGDRIDFEVLAACSVHDREEMLVITDELCRRGFLVEVGPGELGWTHGLMRDAVAAATSPTRSAALHLRLALALEDSAPAATVARHWRLAGSAGRAGAVRHGLRAGITALDQSAWDAASSELEAVVPLAVADDDRAAALIALGHAERGRRRADDARRCFEEALEVARDARLGRRIAESVLGLIGGGGRGVGVHLADEERAALLREALAALGDDDDDLAVPVSSELALSLVLTEGTEAERDALADAALQRARRSGEAATIAAALIGRRSARLDAVSAPSRLVDAEEVLALPARALRPERRLSALLARVEDLLLVGRRAEATSSLAVAQDEAKQLDHPYWLWATTTWASLIALVEGRLDDAEQLSFQAFEHQSSNPEAMAALGVELVDIRLFQGRSAEMIDLLATAADENPNIPAYRAVLALAASESGDVELARSAFEHFASADFTNLPMDSNRFLAVAVLADVCSTLGDARRAPRLRELLTPYDGLQIVLNCYGGGGAYWGPTAWQLARLEATLGDVGAATDRARRALDQARAMGAVLIVERIESARIAQTDTVAKLEWERARS